VSWFSSESGIAALAFDVVCDYGKTTSGTILVSQTILGISKVPFTYSAAKSLA